MKRRGAYVRVRDLACREGVLKMAGTRTVLVTGAAGRIGAAIVGSFVDLGDRVVATDHNGDGMAARIGALGQSAGNVTTLVADITAEAEVELCWPFTLSVANF